MWSFLIFILIADFNYLMFAWLFIMNFTINDFLIGMDDAFTLAYIFDLGLFYINDALFIFLLNYTPEPLLRTDLLENLRGIE